MNHQCTQFTSVANWITPEIRTVWVPRVPAATPQKFKHTDGGLTAKDGELKGFTIAGPDQKWHWATARIVGVTVEVSSPEVPTPVAGRYGWADHPDCNLSNSADLPVSPFRTDDW